MSHRFRPLVLCYHAVTESSPHRLAVRRDALERQVRSVLLRRYRPATAVETLAGRGRIVHVTFDDAFRSVCLAIPVLERLGVPVTVFACSGLADEGAPLAIPELAAEVAEAPDAYATMTWEDLRGIAERGVEIGSHAISHPHLTALSDGDLARELGESRRRIEAELGRPCRLLAYPYGEHDARVRAAGRRAGYEAAFALQAPRWRADPYALPRVDLYRTDGVLSAVLKTSIAYRPASALLRALRRGS